MKQSRRLLVLLPFLWLWMGLIAPSLLPAQTVIDLRRGGGVRAKTVDDYRHDDADMERRLREDSIAYVDNLRRAFNALHRDSLDVAEGLLRECLTLRPVAPSNYIVRHYLGRIDMARGKYAEAATQLSALLRERPDNREIRRERATCYIEAGNPAAALDDCRTLLDAPPTVDEHVRALFLRIAAYSALRQPDRVRQDLEQILRIDPMNESALLLLVDNYAQRGQTTEAMDRLNTFVASHPQHPDGYAARAALEVKQQMWQAARADYDEAIRLRPDDATLLQSRAEVLRHLGLDALAQRDMDEAARVAAQQP